MHLGKIYFFAGILARKRSLEMKKKKLIENSYDSYDELKPKKYP